MWAVSCRLLLRAIATCHSKNHLKTAVQNVLESQCSVWRYSGARTRIEKASIFINHSPVYETATIFRWLALRLSLPFPALCAG